MKVTSTYIIICLGATPTIRHGKNKQNTNSRHEHMENGECWLQLLQLRCFNIS